MFIIRKLLLYISLGIVIILGAWGGYYFYQINASDFPTLIKIQGFSHIIESPVIHLPQVRGKTKYGVQNRPRVGFTDIAAVKWMQKRLIFPEVRSLSNAANNKEEP